MRLGVVVALAALGTFVVTSPNAQAATAPVPLGTAGSFVVLAGAGVTNTGQTTLNGSLGTFPTTSITGLNTVTLNGTNHAGDAVTQGAKAALTTAYTTAAGAGPTQSVPVELGGKTLQPGVYAGGELGLTGTLTLDGGNNPDAVFIFKAASTLITASNSQVKLINVNPCNVFWQVTSSATLGTRSKFVGTIMALTDIHLTTGATLSGRALAGTGAVTLQANTISLPSCHPVTTTTPTPTTSGTKKPSTTPSTTKKPSTTPSTTKTTTTNRGVPSKTGVEDAVDPLAIGGLVVLVGLLTSGALVLRHRREQ